MQKNLTAASVSISCILYLRILYLRISYLFDKPKFEILSPIIHTIPHEIRRNPPQKKYFRRRKIPLLFTCIHMEFISSWYNIVIKCLPYGKTLKGTTYE